MSRALDVGIGRPRSLATFDDRRFRTLTRVSGGSATATADATIHTKGAWVELIASTAADAQVIGVWFEGVSISNTDTRMLIDIGIGAAGVEQVLIANCGGGSCGPGNLGMGFGLPLFVPKGSRISARCQALISADTVSVGVAVYAADFHAPRACVTYGADTANSRGVNMAVTNTYYEVTAATTTHLQGLVFIPTGGGTSFSAGANETITVGVGSAGSEAALTTYLVNTNGNEYFQQEGVAIGRAVGVQWGFPLMAYYPCNIAAGTRLAIKSSTGRSYLDGLLIGVPA